LSMVLRSYFYLLLSSAVHFTDKLGHHK
jgi:hypothetical protein